VFKLGTVNYFGIYSKWCAFEVKRPKVKVTGSISHFAYIHRHSLGGVTSGRRGIELYECLLPSSFCLSFDFIELSSLMASSTHTCPFSGLSLMVYDLQVMKYFVPIIIQSSSILSLMFLAPLRLQSFAVIHLQNDIIKAESQLSQIRRKILNAVLCCVRCRCSSVEERRSLTGGLSLACAWPAADG